ncbi:MAG: T9SS C-terminal target domain-containing protein [Haliscomenobacteraceae bacterium CHB4]|nr:T9SS C-terminal target domain-containing protein [Haliscomenobacteraceae bacterium CHB4]
MKLKSDGSVAFHTKFQGGFVNDAYLGLLPGGKIAVAGTVNYRDITVGNYDLHCLGCHVEDSDIIVAVLDSTGTVLNAKRFGGFGYDYCEGLLCSADGSIYITGSFDSDPFYIDSLVLDNYLGWFSTDAFIVKMDGDLQPQWIKQARSFDFEYGFCLEEDNAGDILWGVHFGGSKVYFDGDTITGGVSNSFLCKMDPDGDTKWTQTFTSSYFNRFLDVAADEHNNLWLAAWYRDTLTFEGGNIIGAGKQDVALVQLDGEGNYLQSFNLAEPGGEIVFQVEPMPGNRLFVVGGGDSLNFLNMHIGPKEGFGDPDFCFILQLPSLAIKETRQYSNALDVSLFPVPASDRLNVRVGPCVHDFKGQVSVCDIYGRLQKQQAVDILCEGTNLVVEVADLLPGMYFLTIQDIEGHWTGCTRFNKI